MGLPMDAVEVEDFDYEGLWYKIKEDTATADNRSLTKEDLKVMASALLKYKLYMKQLDLHTMEEIICHLRSRGVFDMDDQIMWLMELSCCWTSDPNVAMFPKETR